MTLPLFLFSSSSALLSFLSLCLNNQFTSVFPIRYTVMHRGYKSNETDCPKVQKSIGHNVLNLEKQKDTLTLPYLHILMLKTENKNKQMQVCWLTFWLSSVKTTFLIWLSKSPDKNWKLSAPLNFVLIMLVKEPLNLRFFFISSSTVCSPCMCVYFTLFLSPKLEHDCPWGGSTNAKIHSLGGARWSE